MSLTFVFPCYGRPGLLTTALSSFRKFHPSDKVIVVDDGGSNGDEIDHICRVYDAVYFRKENGGFSSACNFGIEKSEDDQVVLCNTDLEFTCRLTERIERAFLRDDKVAVVGGLLYYPDGRIQHGGGFYWWHQTGHYGHGKRLSDAQLCSIPAYRLFVTGALTAIDRTKVPKFDETLISDSEDGDLCLKVWQAGNRVIYDPSITAIHHEGKTRGVTIQEKHENGNLDKGMKANQEFKKRMLEADLEGIHDTINKLNSHLHPRLPKALVRKGAIGDVVRVLPILQRLTEKVVIVTGVPELFRDMDCVAITRQLDEFATSCFIDLDLTYERHRERSIQESYFRKIWPNPVLDVGETKPCQFTANQLHWHFVKELAPQMDWTQPYIVMHIGQKWESKTFPTAFWTSLVQNFINLGYIIITVGSGNDLPGDGPRVVNLVGKTTLSTLRALLEHAALFIGPDSGPLHLSDGACPSIGLFTIALPELTVSKAVTPILSKVPCVGCIHKQPVAEYWSCFYPEGDPKRFMCTTAWDVREIITKGLELIKGKS